MKKHITIIGIYHIAVNALLLLMAVFVLLIMILSAFLTSDRSSAGIIITTGVLIALFMGALGLPGLIGGIGLLRYKNWARYLVMIVAVLELFMAPIGTAVAIYTLWALVHDETVTLFSAPKPTPPANPE